MNGIEIGLHFSAYMEDDILWVFTHKVIRAHCLEWDFYINCIASFTWANFYCYISLHAVLFQILFYYLSSHSLAECVTDSKVKFMRESLEKAGCPVGRKFFKAKVCGRATAGGYDGGGGVCTFHLWKDLFLVDNNLKYMYRDSII